MSTPWLAQKNHLCINVHYCICWKSFKLEMETHGSGGEEKLCHSPAQVVHRLSGTWPAGTILWLSHIWASDLTVGYSCWLLPSYGEISFDKQREKFLMGEVIWITFPVTCLFSFSSLSHDSTFFKQQEIDVKALTTAGVQHWRVFCDKVLWRWWEVSIGGIISPPNALISKL